MAIQSDLDSESKLDRDPVFIGALMKAGAAQAEEFLAQRSVARARRPA